MAFELPDLPYAADALEPSIDTMTMQIHHDKHHAAYVTNLNNAIAGTQWENHSVEEILRNINRVPENIRTAVRNNGGGHANHTLFWNLMGPHAGGEPTGALADAINATFGSFSDFKAKFKQAAMGRFGSGWAWLVMKGDGGLDLYSLPNQDSPLMEGDTPVLGIDVWEHAYYLKYQNRRADYIDAWWNVVDWNKVAENYSATR
jgi:Fe-Mn family superoxide dismutase